MPSPTEEFRSGLDYLEAVSALLNRVRTAHPTAGLFEAADMQWWWSMNERPTDDLDQLFWFDDRGRPEAAAIITGFGNTTLLNPLVLPDATPEWTEHVMRRGLDHASESGFDSVCLEVDRTDHVLRAVLSELGFTVEEDGLVESWLSADGRPPISDLEEGYLLLDRASAMDRPHHMINERRNHPDSEPRLNQTSLYRSDLDLVVYDDEGNVAAYGLFWYDPTTAVGLVEPMRTEDEHQSHGLARHVLTCGIDRLANAGATRIKIGFEPDNAVAKHLYLSAGFEPHRENDILAGPTST